MPLDLAFQELMDISSYGGKLFKVDPQPVKCGFSVPGLDSASDAGKTIKDLMTKGWQAELAKQVKAYKVNLVDILKDTEKRVYASAKKLGAKIGDPKKWLEEEAKGAEVMIRNAIKTFQSTLEKAMFDIFDKISAAVDKKFKTELNGLKKTALARILINVGIIVVAAAVALVAAAAGVAATGATMGAGAVTFAVVAPVVATAVVTIAKAGKNIYDSVDKNWPTYKKQLVSLQTALQEYQTEIAYVARKNEKTKLNVIEKVKLLTKDVKGKRTAVETAITNSESWTGALQMEIFKLQGELAPIDEQIKKLEVKDANPSTLKEATNVVDLNAKFRDKVSGANTYIKRLEDTIKEAKQVVKDDKTVQDPSKLKGVIGKVQAIANDDTVQNVLSSGATLLQGVVKIGGALSKVA